MQSPLQPKRPCKRFGAKVFPQEAVFSNLIQSDAGSKIVHRIKRANIDTLGRGQLFFLACVTKGMGAGV
jgi:hypothetical protein